MRSKLLAVLIALAAAPIRASDSIGAPWADLWGFQSLTGGYHLGRARIEARVGPTGRYRVSAEAKSWRIEKGPKGATEEYSASLTRELYHVAVSGTLGTAPPNSQGAAYHIAGGDVLLTFYGLSLGPGHPDLSSAVWESSGAVPAGLNREWVTRLRGRYTNIDDHIAFPRQLLSMVENVWQFDLSETWRESTTFLAHGGGTRYNRTLFNNAPRIYKNNIEYPGNAFPIFGWPNNWVSGSVRQRLTSDIQGWFAGTRLNLLGNDLVAAYGGGLSWRPPQGLGAAAAYYHLRRRSNSTREGFSLELSYRW